MSRKESPDRRWRGVTVPSLHTVILRTTEPDENRAALAAEAWQELRSGGIWRGYEAVFSGHNDPQVKGYRRVNPKDWFLIGPGADLEGPFPSKRLILSKLKLKASKKTTLPGVYTAGEGDYVLFTRDAAYAVGLTRGDLP